MRRMITGKLIEWIKSLKEKVVQNGNTTEVGGNLEVDGTIKSNSGLVARNILSDELEQYYNEESEQYEITLKPGEKISLYKNQVSHKVLLNIISSINSGLVILGVNFSEKWNDILDDFLYGWIVSADESRLQLNFNANTSYSIIVECDLSGNIICDLIEAY